MMQRRRGEYLPRFGAIRPAIRPPRDRPDQNINQYPFVSSLVLKLLCSWRSSIPILGTRRYRHGGSLRQHLWASAGLGRSSPATDQGPSPFSTEARRWYDLGKFRSSAGAVCLGVHFWEGRGAHQHLLAADKAGYPRIVRAAHRRRDQRPFRDGKRFDLPHPGSLWPRISAGATAGAQASADRRRSGSRPVALPSFVCTR